MNVFRFKTAAIALSALLLSGVAEQSRAALITFDFAGTIPIADLGFAGLLTGSYTFESETEINDRGIYQGAIVAMDISLGDTTTGILTASATSPGDILVNAGSGPDTGQYQVLQVPMSGDPESPIQFLDFGFQLIGLSLASNALPILPPQNWLISAATLKLAQPGVTRVGSIDSITLAPTTVPEPATAILVGLALIAGTLIGHRRIPLS